MWEVLKAGGQSKIHDEPPVECRRLDSFSCWHYITLSNALNKLKNFSFVNLNQLIPLETYLDWNTLFFVVV